MNVGTHSELGLELRRLRGGTKQAVVGKRLALELGRESPYDRRTISGWETGASIPPEEAVRAYARLFATEPPQVKVLEAKLLGLLERVQSERTGGPRRYIPRVALGVVVLLGVLVGATALGRSGGSSSDGGTSKGVLHRFSKADGRCRLNARPHRSFLQGEGWHHDGPIAKVEVSEDTGAEKLLSYAFTTTEPSRTTYHTYVREGDTNYIDALKARGWEPTTGQVKDVGLIYSRREGATTPLWRGRKGLAYCFSTERADLQSAGYDNLEVAGYVWPLG